MRANGEDNRDGQDENYSWNNGVEGPNGRPGHNRTPQEPMRARCLRPCSHRAAARCSCAGDEFGRTQAGNNNAYAQDNQVTWLDWQDRDRELEDFVSALAAARATRLSDEAADFVPEAEWRDLEGGMMTAEKWQDGSLEGFEVRIALRNGSCLSLRLDRKAGQCIQKPCN